MLGGKFERSLDDASKEIRDTGKALAETNKTIQALSGQFIDVQKRLSDIRPVNLADPAVARNIATALKDAGIDNPQIVIVPPR
jgi:hypothetical protein